MAEREHVGVAKLSNGLRATRALAVAVATLLASTNLLAQSVDLTQCANDNGPPNANKNDGVIDACKWINGALNANNSDYAESDGVPMRAFISFPSAGSHSVVFQYDFTKNDIYAYDFLVDIDHTMPQSLLNPCEGLPTQPSVSQSECDSMWSGPDANTQNVQFISDTFDSVPLKEHPANRYLRLGCYPQACTNAAISSIVHVPATDCFQNCGTSVAQVTLTFDTPVANSLAGLWFSAELAPSFDPDPFNDPPSGWGAGYGVSSIGGAPFDLRMVSVDGGSVGSLVNQMNDVLQLGHLADLAVDKTGPAQVTQGNQISYQVTVTNNGPDSVTNVLFSDVIPSGTTFVSATPNNGTSCSFAGGVVSCDLGLLAPDESVVVNIVVGTTGINPTSCASGGGLVNQAQINAPVNDSNPANNSDTVCTTVVAPTPIADLALTKSDSPDPVTAGNNLTYTLSVTNNGPNAAANVVVTDTLPAGVSFVSASGTNWTCNHLAGVITCDYGLSLAASTSAPNITVTVTVDPATRGVINNTASVTSDATDNTPGNNSDTEPTTVVGSADVAITKTGPASATGGNQISYTISVTNNGPSTATDVDVVDVLPTTPNGGPTFVSATPSTGSCSYNAGTRTVTCELGTMAPSATETVTLTVQTPAVASTSSCPGAGLQNTATATGFVENDPTPGNNSDDACTTLNPPPPQNSDLTVTKSDSPDPVIAGQNLTYTIQINNVSPTVGATGVTFSDPLPTGTTFVSLTQPGGWTCSTPAVGATGTVTCSNGTIAASSSASFTLVVNVDSSYPGVDNPATTGVDEDLIQNTVTVTADNDPTPTEDTEDTDVNASSDLAVTKTDADPYGPDPVIQGNALVYGITVTNNGPSDATGVVVTDTLPTDLTFNPATSFGGCSAIGQVVTCNVTSIAAGQSVTFSIGVNVAADATPGTVTNNVSVTGDQPDGNSENNTDSEDTTINALPVEEHDLAVTKTDSADPVLAGTSLAYTLTVTDLSDNQNLPNGVTVVDTLPAGVTFVSASPAQADCTHAAGVVTCNIGQLPSDPFLITITVSVNGTTRGTITNSVTVSTTETDTNSENDSDTEDTLVNGAADLAIDKQAPAQVPAGSQISYTLTVTNGGPSAATSVVVTDTLPPAAIFVSASGTNWSCNHVAGVVTCTYLATPLAASTSAPAITVVVNTQEESGGSQFVNVGIVEGNEDPNSENNTDTVVTDIVPVGAIPVLSPFGIALVAVLMAIAGWLAIRRTS